MANKLTPKQKKFADEYIKTGNGTKSALKTYDTDDYSTAASIANENLNKPEIVAYLDSHVKQASNVILEIMNDKEANESVRIVAAKDVLDRTIGRPKERIEQDSKQDITVKIVNYANDDNSAV